MLRVCRQCGRRHEARTMMHRYYCSMKCANAAGVDPRGRIPGFIKNQSPSEIKLEPGEQPGTRVRSGDDLVEYRELYSNRADNRVPLTRNTGRTHGGTSMGRPSIHDEVTIHAPENPKLHGSTGTVRLLREWGAVLDAPAAATGEFRALWCEMVKVEQEPKPGKPPQGVYLNGSARNAGYTGDVCPACQGSRLRRTGTCVTCEDCGTNEGCS